MPYIVNITSPQPRKDPKCLSAILYNRCQHCTSCEVVFGNTRALDAHINNDHCMDDEKTGGSNDTTPMVVDFNDSAMAINTNGTICTNTHNDAIHKSGYSNESCNPANIYMDSARAERKFCYSTETESTSDCSKDKSPSEMEELMTSLQTENDEYQVATGQSSNPPSTLKPRWTPTKNISEKCVKSELSILVKEIKPVYVKTEPQPKIPLLPPIVPQPVPDPFTNDDAKTLNGSILLKEKSAVDEKIEKQDSGEARVMPSHSMLVAQPDDALSRGTTKVPPPRDRQRFASLKEVSRSGEKIVYGIDAVFVTDGKVAPQADGSTERAPNLAPKLASPTTADQTNPVSDYRPLLLTNPSPPIKPRSVVISPVKTNLGASNPLPQSKQGQKKPDVIVLKPENITWTADNITIEMDDKDKNIMKRKTKKGDRVKPRKNVTVMLPKVAKPGNNGSGANGDTVPFKTFNMAESQSNGMEANKIVPMEQNNMAATQQNNMAAPQQNNMAAPQQNNMAPMQQNNIPVTQPNYMIFRLDSTSETDGTSTDLSYENILSTTAGTGPVSTTSGTTGPVSATSGTTGPVSATSGTTGPISATIGTLGPISGTSGAGPMSNSHPSPIVISSTTDGSNTEGETANPPKDRKKKRIVFPPFAQIGRHYVCPVCGNQFRSLTNGRRHYMQHLEGCYLCTLCGRGYRYRASLQKHYAFVHDIVSGIDNPVLT